MNAAIFSRILAAAFLILGIAVCFEAYKLGFISFGVPASGLFPIIAGGVLVVSSLAAMLLPNEAGMESEIMPWRLPVALMLAVAGYFVLFEILGVYLATAIYLAVSLLVAQRLSALSVAITAVVSLLVIYLVFQLWLRIPMPMPMFW